MAQERTAQNRPWEILKPEGRMLRPQQVIDQTGLSRTQIYQMITERRFPPFVKLSTRASAMPENWLAAFFESRAQQAIEGQNQKALNIATGRPS
ncbi:MAG: helix-turn-helix transcriptional regulator [Maricaulaceae bacterium]